MSIKKAPERLRFAAVAVDAVVFSVIEGELHVLLAPVHRPPYYLNMRGFIGGLIDPNETAEEAVTRHLKDKGGLKDVYVEQLYTFSEVERDPRNRVIAVAYIGCVTPEVALLSQKGGAVWAPVNEIANADLPYDHSEMLRAAVTRLQGKLAYTTIAQFLLPHRFTLTELQQVYEVILRTKLDKRNFRKKILALDILKDTKKMQEGVKNRPALLYEFKSKTIKELPLF